MPAQRTTTRTTKPASTTRATSKSTGNSGRAPARTRQAKQPFREVTLVVEGYLAIQGLDDEDFDLAACPRCAGLIPSGEKAEAGHRAWHDEIDRVIEQLTEAIHGLESRS